MELWIVILAIVVIVRVCPKCHSPYWNTPKKPAVGREKGAR